MRTHTPRLPPLKDDELNAEQEAYISQFPTRAINAGAIRSLLNNVQASKAFRGWSQYTMGGETKLPVREREVVALRTAWLIKSGFVWSRHIPYGRSGGLTDVEMEALKRPISDHPWSAADIALIKAAEALVSDFFIPDDVWAELIAHFDNEQIIDAIFVCGHFCMLGMFLNSAGVPIDSDVISDPDLIKIQD